MKISSMGSSKYLKKEDCDPPRLLTFRSFSKINVARDDESEDHKWVAFFDGEDKGLVLNRINLERAANALGSDDTDDWIGKNIVLYHEPNVEFAGKLVGGIRLRAAKGQQAPVKAPAPPVNDLDDDIPF